MPRIHADNPANLPAEEVSNYVARTQRKMAEGEIPSDVDRIEILPAGDGDVEIRYYRSVPRFERIRRITGYLTGTLNTWNDAKRAEERDRVKHGGVPAPRD